MLSNLGIPTKNHPNISKLPISLRTPLGLVQILLGYVGTYTHMPWPFPLSFQRHVGLQFNLAPSAVRIGWTMEVSGFPHTLQPDQIGHCHLVIKHGNGHPIYRWFSHSISTGFPSHVTRGYQLKPPFLDTSATSRGFAATQSDEQGTWGLFIIQRKTAIWGVYIGMPHFQIWNT